MIQSSISIGQVFEDNIKSNLSLHQRFKLKQLKNITNAAESICILILQKENFDLDASVNHYFQHYNTQNSDQKNSPSTNASVSESIKLASLDEKEKWTQLKNITHASDTVCESILRKYKFDLNASIEAFFRGDYNK